MSKFSIPVLTEGCSSLTGYCGLCLINSTLPNLFSFLTYRSNVKKRNGNCEGEEINIFFVPLTAKKRNKNISSKIILKKYECFFSTAIALVVARPIHAG